MFAAGLEQRGELRNRVLLLHCLGMEGSRILASLPGLQNTTALIMERLETYYCPTRTVTHYRAKLFGQRQKKTENVLEFALVVRKLATNCEFGMLEDNIARDVFIAGLQNERARGNLIVMSSESFKTA